MDGLDGPAEHAARLVDEPDGEIDAFLHIAPVGAEIAGVVHNHADLDGIAGGSGHHHSGFGRGNGVNGGLHDSLHFVRGERFGLAVGRLHNGALHNALHIGGSERGLGGCVHRGVHGGHNDVLDVGGAGPAGRVGDCVCDDLLHHSGDFFGGGACGRHCGRGHSGGGRVLHFLLHDGADLVGGWAGGSGRGGRRTARRRQERAGAEYERKPGQNYPVF